MKKVAIIMAILLVTTDARSFCGFFVAKAGAKLFNNKSEVILVRDGTKSVITMSNDFKGDVKDFAMVVPVPEILRERDIKVVNRYLFDQLDAYSAPRLVEYYDPAPCNQYVKYKNIENRTTRVNSMILKDEVSMNEEDKDMGVTIEAKYTVGEYDILILSAKESEGLKTWLTANGYTIPAKAERVLEPYIKSNMKFFVVKVNLEKKKQSNFNYLRPIQITFNSPKFMLPIRLGMANSNGAQDMIVYAFTKTGRVEAANYRTIEMPTARKIPTFVKQKFEQFYFDAFDKAYANEGKKSVFIEYAWNVTPTFRGMKCDPCVGPPPLTNQLLEAGVDWASSGQQVYFSRLHVRYTESKFPQDLQFVVTPNRTNYQARYILTHPAPGKYDCEKGKEYMESLKQRRDLELSELEVLTDWNTAKYTKYVSEGTNYVNEKQDSWPLGGKTPNDGGGNNMPWGFLLIMTGIVATGGLYYLRNRQGELE